jgi:hypothetical protein
VSRRERLGKRKLPSATVSIRLDPTSTEADDAREDLRQAEFELRLAEESPDHTRLPALREAVEAAQARVDAAFEYFVINAIPAPEFEALIHDHPPTADQRKEGFSWNRESFFPALLAACVEGSESAQDWADMLKDGTFILGEWTALISTALQLNDRSPDVSLGKGSTSIRS